MTSPVLTASQTQALNSLEEMAGKRGWQGETAVVEGTLVYQVQLPEDPDVCGAFFAIDADECNVRLHLILPFSMPASRIAEACEFVVRSSYSRKYGALEFDSDHGTLRVRMDADFSEATVAAAVARLFDRAAALARAVSPAWRRLCGESSQHVE